MFGISVENMISAACKNWEWSKRFDQGVYYHGVPGFPGKVMEFKNGHGNHGKFI